MSDTDFDRRLIASAFHLASEVGWSRVNVHDAARAADLPLAEARARFPGKRAVVRRFGVLMDQAVLAAASHDGPVRDQLFDLIMSRFDVMKPHRAGIRALVQALPADPLLALELACATEQSMRWMLHAAGQSTSGLSGRLRVKGLCAVWSWVYRTFDKDESDDLSATMAALDKALERAHEAANWLGGARAPSDESAVPEES